jgi:hypothetical protein
MQKISSYLYPNRIQLLADLAGFTTEYTNVYQRTVRLYKGVDNVLEFDIKNADQKRLELVTSPDITNLHLNIMDESGNAVGNTPYTLTPSGTVKGIASVTIPAADLASLNQQFLNFSVTATKGSATVPLYADSRFGALGKIDLVGSAVPTTRAPRTYKDFVGEIDLSGNVLHHSSAIPAKFYEAEATTSLTFAVHITSGFLGTVIIESTPDMTISQSSWQPQKATSTQIFSNESGGVPTSLAQTITVTQSVGTANYFRVTWHWPGPTSAQYGFTTIYSGYSTDNGPGKVDLITVS